MKAFHQAFLESAAQGISLFASAGDSGAFDINDAFNDPVANVLSVDAPAADPAITAAGGTTTPLTHNAGPGTPDLVVSSEQVWGWDYIENYLVSVLGPGFLHYRRYPCSGSRPSASAYNDWPRIAPCSARQCATGHGSSLAHFGVSASRSQSQRQTPNTRRSQARTSRRRPATHGRGLGSDHHWYAARRYFGATNTGR